MSKSQLPCVCRLNNPDTSCELSTATASSRRAFGAALFGLATTLAAAEKSEASTNRVCPVGEEGMECRQQYLMEDNNGLANQDYGAFRNRDMGRTAAAQSPSDAKYLEATLDLVDRVESYMAMDVYDKQRGPIVAALQKDGNQWVGKYAPGGSSKKESGRAFYNALVSLLGHVSFNGLAPMRGSMEKQILANCTTTRELLADSR